ncbi:MAG: cell division protein FtsW [Lachnospiraceae bacterium]|nr:cell division protein FtsW [Lachnospiraceae bacterium]
MPEYKVKPKKEKVQRFYDYSLLFVIIFLACFGLVMVYSTSSYTAMLENGDSFFYAKRQGAIMAASFFIMLAVSKIDYHIFPKFAAVAYFLSFACMILVNYVPGFGKEVNGKKRWLMIGNVTLFQPSEMVKVAVILCLACFIVRVGKKIDRLKALILVAVMVLPVAYLVLDNNLSTGIIILGIAFLMYFVASRKKALFGLIVGGGVLLIFAFIELAPKLVEWGILEDYQLSRIVVWQDPESYARTGGHQVLQGLYAIGSGGLFGKGLGNSIQKLGFVPEAQNDMIFSIICEELGLFGAFCVILLFLFMIWRFMVIAGNAPDLLGAMLVVGIMSHIALQVVLNIAVVTNTIPNTGITLPFISYGGTSVVFLMIEMGMALSVSNQIRISQT